MDVERLQAAVLMFALPLLAGVEYVRGDGGHGRFVFRPKKALAAVLTLCCAIEMAYIAEAWWRHRMSLREVPPNLSAAAGVAFRTAFQREALMTLVLPAVIACRAFSHQPWVAVGVAKAGAGLGALLAAHLTTGSTVARGLHAGHGAGVGAAVALVSLFTAQFAGSCMPARESQMWSAARAGLRLVAAAVVGALALTAYLGAWEGAIR